ncbi:MAG: trypsin-like serine protease, partial [Parvularcula sp.]|nr:trypsin-like serine protease [Parvularcula sp.]
MLDLLSLRRGLLLAASATAFTAAGAALASDAPSSDIGSIDIATLTGAGAEDAPAIITRDDIDPDLEPPFGSLDLTGINGIGQMIAESPEGGFGLCTGSLINPRTVLFAAHCVNDVPQDAYGSNTGGL